jgi:hypothetical protein
MPGASRYLICPIFDGYRHQGKDKPSHKRKLQSGTPACYRGKAGACQVRQIKIATRIATQLGDTR